MAVHSGLRKEGGHHVLHIPLWRVWFKGMGLCHEQGCDMWRKRLAQPRHCARLSVKMTSLAP